MLSPHRTFYKALNMGKMKITKSAGSGSDAGQAKISKSLKGSSTIALHKMPNAPSPSTIGPGSTTVDDKVMSPS
jgi:hypothetical protein